MNFIIKITLFILFIFLTSCANNKQIVYDKDKRKFVLIEKKISKVEKIYYSSKGFALIYESDLYTKGVINKKFDNNEIVDNQINHDKIRVMHSSLKKGTPIKIINPKNSKIVETEIFGRAKYLNIFNVVISKKVAKTLELDFRNPYVELLEAKKNKVFIAKEGITHDEEKKVLDTAPVKEIKMDDLSKDKNEKEKKLHKKNNFVLVVADFYYLDSANELKKKLVKQTKINNFSVKKVNDNKYRLSAGPFENFNSLKSTYISLNNLGFNDLNVYNE